MKKYIYRVFAFYLMYYPAAQLVNWLINTLADIKYSALLIIILIVATILEHSIFGLFNE